MNKPRLVAARTKPETVRENHPRRLRLASADDPDRLRNEHRNVENLLLVLESHLAIMIMGEPLEGAVMLDTVDYLLDYVSELHRGDAERVDAAERPGASSCAATLSAQHDALATSGAELYHRLALAIRDASVDRGEVVRLGYAYCTALRRVMLREQALVRLAAARTDDAAGHRARFEDLTRRIGCDCAYGQR